MTVAIADDSALIREGLAAMLQRYGFVVVCQEGRADSLRQSIDHLAHQQQLPQLLITDVRMPPTMSNDGLVAALELRQRHPELSLVVLSQYILPTYAQQLFGTASASGTGYLLKDKISEVREFIHSLHVIADGGVVIDPEAAKAMVTTGRSRMAELTEREHEVLELMATGMSNNDIAQQLFISPAAVSKHVANIFAKLGLSPSQENRRVRAILRYLSEVRPWT
ncbi:response regulator transcription factor (plasmid) [Corynebacterium qintianiae]|uniref:Response regulator transcription factor n=1 Tax=Corynebacterium qintianiae TaxID=2709392 RepID=A0A7T0KPB3_9CORY|nr:response regulator transcription factor [Corynebacterium qintianiae]